MRVKFLHTIAGTFHNDPNGVQAGQVVDLDPIHAKRYIEHDLAVPVDGDSAHF